MKARFRSLGWLTAVLLLLALVRPAEAEPGKALDVDSGGVCGAVGAGGPDAFGYRVASSLETPGPVYGFVDISASGTSVALGDDTFAGPFPIGFSFPFYEAAQTEFFVSSNGLISFGSGSTTLLNQCPLPSVTTPNNLIALMWDDLDPGDTADLVYYQTFASCPKGGGACLVVQYQNFHHFPGGGAIAGTFEAILYASGDILVQYADAGAEEGSGSTTGIENGAGTVGLAYACNSAASLADGLAVLFTANPSNSWWRDAAAPFEATRFGCAWFDDGTGPSAYNRKIYCPGGRTDTLEFPDIWRFDPMTGTWEDTGVDLPEDVSNFTPNVIVDENLASDGPGIYVVGGYNADGGAYATLLQRYYPRTGTVGTVGSDPWPGTVGGQPATPGACVAGPNGTKIYCFGGYNSLASPYVGADTWEYSPARPAGTRWLLLGPALGEARSYIQAAVSGNRIYALGGDTFPGNLTATTTAEVLDLGNLAAGWVPLAPLPVASGEGRAFAVAGRIYVAGGGAWPSESAEVMSYDIAAGTWSLDPRDLNFARRDHAGAFVPVVSDDPTDGAAGLWVFGGRRGSDSPPYMPPEHLPLPVPFRDTFADGDATGDPEWTESGAWKTLAPRWHPGDPMYTSPATGRPLSLVTGLVVGAGRIELGFRITKTSFRRNVMFPFDFQDVRHHRYVQIRQLPGGAWKIYLKQRGDYGGETAGTKAVATLPGFNVRQVHALAISMDAAGGVEVELDGASVLSGAFATPPTGGRLGLRTDRTKIFVDDYTVIDETAMP